MAEVTPEKNQSSSKPNPDKPQLPEYAKFVGLAIEIVILNVIIIWGGIYLDGKFPSLSPTFLIAGVLLATVATIYYLLMRLNRK